MAATLASENQRLLDDYNQQVYSYPVDGSKAASPLSPLQEFLKGRRMFGVFGVL